jgi:hypothetical protein
MSKTRIADKPGTPVKANEGNGWFCGGPYNERDRRRFEALPFEDKLWVENRARQLYGLYTISRGWTIALDECLDPEVVGAEGNVVHRASRITR